MRLWPLLVALAVVVIGPIAMRPKGDESVLEGQDRVVAITPHNEAIRSEFGRGFRDWYHAKTGRTVVVDFRSPGGTSEITRYLNGAYIAAFQKHWRDTARKPWTAEVEKGWNEPKIELDDTPADDTEAQ